MFVRQLVRDEMTCCELCTPSDTRSRSGSSLSALASAGTRRFDVPPPCFTPPAATAPGMIMIMFVPAPRIWSSIAACAPVPSATIVMTAATPMIMPSIVSSVRSLLRASALKAIRIVIRIDMLECLTADGRAWREAECEGAVGQAGVFLQVLEPDRVRALVVGRHETQQGQGTPVDEQRQRIEVCLLGPGDQAQVPFGRRRAGGHAGREVARQIAVSRQKHHRRRRFIVLRQ